MKLVNIDQLQKRVASELSLTKTPIVEAAKQNAVLQHYYLGLLFKERSKLKRVEGLYKLVKAKSYKKNKWNSDIKMSGSEAKQMAILDDPVTKTKDILERQSEIVEYLNGVISIFNNRSFTLNSLMNYYSKNSEILNAEELLND